MKVIPTYLTNIEMTKNENPELLNSCLIRFYQTTIMTFLVKHDNSKLGWKSNESLICGFKELGKVMETLD